MAAGARAGGAEIYRQVPVTNITKLATGEWLVETPKGNIKAEHIVNAAGTWGYEIGRMMGVDLPMVPMLHQYLVTDTVAEVAERIEQGLPELPIIRDPEESWYVRQERDGLISGPYEKDALPWSIDSVPPEFGMELLPPDLDRVEDIVAMSMERIPALANAGIKTIVNGPITFTPDANPLIGPAYNLQNAWLLTGSSMGVMEGGGAGKLLAEWMVEGEPGMDALAVDSRRFGGYADRDYRVSKAIECFGLQFGVHYPYEERPAARGKIKTPIYDKQADAGAVFGAAYGWERPNYFRQEGDAGLSFGRPGWFDNVRQECLNVQNNVGVADASAFSKFVISGPDASAFMNTLGANTAPKKPGRIGLIHALTPKGGVASEFTVTKESDDAYYLTSAAAARRHDLDLLNNHAGTLDVSIADKTQDIGILSVMGPKSRDVLSKLSDADFSTPAFPWLSAQHITVAGIEAHALRVSYVGELGWELHVTMDDMAVLFDALLNEDVNLFGVYAMNAMRLEKGYRAWGMDLSIERTPLEAGLSFLVKAEGRDFKGRDAMLARAGRNDAWTMELLEVENQDGSDPFYLHTVFDGDTPVGIVTSAAVGMRTDKTLALAYFRTQPSSSLHVEILGERFNATVLSTPPYDPTNERMKV